MRIQFSHIERTAGLFVLASLFAFFAFGTIVAFKQGWFSARHHYRTLFDHGDGLHAGTLVQIAGLRAGQVESVTLTDENHIEVALSISHEFMKRVRKDSVARVIRPFIIGDKVVEVTVGSGAAELLGERQLLNSEETMDVMDLLGGGKLGPYLATIDSLLKNLKTVAEAFADPKRSAALIGMFDEMLPTLTDLREMTQQMTRNKNLSKSMQNLTTLTNQMNAMLPEMAAFSKQLPQLGEQGVKTMVELNAVTTEVSKFLPLLNQMAPQLPEASQKGVEALKEAIIVLRAMQKSFLLRGAVKDVQEEDARNPKREPSQEHEQKR